MEKSQCSERGFSALSLSFAYELYKELNVPIGILLSAHSNTRIEAFTQREAIEKHPKLTGDADRIRDADPLCGPGPRWPMSRYYSGPEGMAGSGREDGRGQGARSLPDRSSRGLPGCWRRAVSILQWQDRAGHSLRDPRRNLVSGHQQRW